MTIIDKIRDTFSDYTVGMILTREEIINIVCTKHGTKPGSVIPSDYCYNRNNKGVRLEGKFTIFEFLGGSRYKYLGEGYPYTGKIYAKERGCIKENVIGEWDNGKVILYKETKTFEEDFDIQEGRLPVEYIDKTVFTEQKDFPLSAIREMYDEGDIIPNPDYQRDYVYNDKQASRYKAFDIANIDCFVFSCT